MGISLYRRYRPQKFSEVTGQSSAVDVLTKSLERSLVGHAYLFSGPRGCGKTTAARLLAKALNCLAPAGSEPCCECKNCLAIAAGESLDVVEIDGASNNGVEEVRELKTHVTLAPFSSRYKVYIIDEVHMLSIAAFNALLKTLEEPPAYVVFILATTEAHKVPVTIRSRCQHIPFHRIGTREISERLALVCSAEGIVSAPDALWEIARQADGALRDALSMLEQISGLGKTEIILADVEAALGQISRSSMERWLSGWRGAERQEAGLETFTELDRLLSSGASPQRFIEELFSLVRNLWLAARWQGALPALDASEQEKEYLDKEARLWEPAELESVMRFLAELMPQVRMGLRIDVLSGLLMAKIANLKDEPKGDIPGGAHQNGVSMSRAPQSRAGAPGVPRKAPGFPNADAAQPSAPARAAVPAQPAVSPAPVSAPAERLNEAAWKPYPEDKWAVALNAVREEEFLLYCALLDASPFMDEERSGALILNIEERYCYEVLRLDRHRASLKNILASFNDAGEVILRCGERLISCDASPAAPQTAGPARKRGGAEKEAGSQPYAEEPFRSARDIEAQGSPYAAEIPFAGLVQEVTRLLSGELIMVRSGEPGEADDYDSAADEIPGEEQ